MEVDLQSLFGIHVHCAQLYSLAEAPQPLTPPPPLTPRIWALLVVQDRRPLIMTPWLRRTEKMTKMDVFFRQSRLSSLLILTKTISWGFIAAWSEIECLVFKSMLRPEWRTTVNLAACKKRSPLYQHEQDKNYKSGIPLKLIFLYMNGFAIL